MFKNYLLLLICTALISCHSSNKELKVVIENPDSVVINYFNADSANTVQLVKIIHNKKAMDSLVDLITVGTTNSDVHCGLDGSIHFFKQDSVVQDIYFTMRSDSCMYFIFKQDGEKAVAPLSPEAKALLVSLKR